MGRSWTLILSILVAGRLAAQDSARFASSRSTELPVCDAATLTPNDTSRARVVLVPPASAKAKSKQAQLAAGAARVLAASFVPPPEVPLRAWTGTWYLDSSASARGDRLRTHFISATLEIAIDTAGRLQVAKMLRRSAAPLLDAAIMLAAQRADSQGAFAALPSFDKKTRVIQLVVATTAPDDTLGVDILRLRLPFRRLTQPVRVRHIPQPAYPKLGLVHRVEEQVEFQYVVGADGRVQPGSVRLVNEPYQEFVEAAHEALVHAEFAPARIGDCAAPQLVQQIISFRVRR